MDGNRHGLHERRVLDRQSVGDAKHNVLGHDDELGKRPVTPIIPARYAEHLAAVAQVNLPRVAEVAIAARDHRVKRHPIARPELRDVGPDLGNFPSGLVPHDERRNPPPARSVVTVDVAPADAARAHANQDIARAVFGLWNVGQLELPFFR